MKFICNKGITPYIFSLIDMDIARFAKHECVFLVEHEGIISAGKSFESSDFLSNYTKQIYYSTRGGRVTVHNPGQLVVYPIINLRKRELNVSSYVHMLEEWIISALSKFGIVGQRSEAGVGVWTTDNEKIGFIGIRIENGVSYHGLCLNVNNDLSPFKSIIPCGLQSVSITSISRHLGRNITTEEVKKAFIETCVFYPQ